MVPEGGHDPQAERPDVVNPRLVDFVASVSGRA
jgi:pimeloyl-ACP methyl ester carboxylesterase